MSPLPPPASEAARCQHEALLLRVTRLYYPTPGDQPGLYQETVL